MASYNFSIGSQAASGHLISVMRKTSDLSTVVAIVDTYPSNNGNFQFVNIDVGLYRIEVRDSPDGSALGTQIGNPYSVKVEDLGPGLEHRFYTADGSQLALDGVTIIDPVSGQPDLRDPYLNGKTIDSVHKEGFRNLIPAREYTLLSGGGIHLVGGMLFGNQEVFEITLAVKVANPVVTANLFAGYSIITTDTNLDSTFYNKKIKCLSATSRMVNSLPAVAGVPESSFYYFTTFNCNQYNTVFNCYGGDTIEGFGPQIILGMNEILWIEKRGSQWEVMEVSDGVFNVGKRFASQIVSRKNTLTENDILCDGLDYPRSFYFFKHILPATHRIDTTDSLIAALVRTTANTCLPIVGDTKFRMPNTQGLSERGLASFTVYGTDTARLYDYPFGFMPEMIGPHSHGVATQNKRNKTDAGDPDYQRAEPHNSESWNAGSQTDANQNNSTNINKTADNSAYTTENRVNNFGVIYLMQI